LAQSIMALSEALVKLTPDDEALVPVIVPSAFCNRDGYCCHGLASYFLIPLTHQSANS
jgi:hypothetical protein